MVMSSGVAALTPRGRGAPTPKKVYTHTHTHYFLTVLKIIPFVFRNTPVYGISPKPTINTQCVVVSETRVISG